MTPLRTFWLVVVLAALGVRGLPGRVPKVYNALITSGQNLAPSKSFPVYQPFYQESYGFPLPATYYFSDDSSVYKSYFAQSPQLGAGQASGATAPTGPAPTLAARRQDAPPPPPPPPQPSDKPQEEAPTSPKETLPPRPPPPPATQSPIPLNEFGLPPAIVPLNAGQPEHRPFVYDPFTDFSPYYPQLDYPDPYSFRSYPLLPPIYRFGGELLREGGIFPLQPQPPPPPQPQLTPAVASAPPQPSPPGSSPPSPPGSSPQTPPPVAPGDLSINNYSGKDPSIPDVPPPPLPSAGFNDAPSNDKTK